MLKKIVKFFGGDPNKRELDKNQALVEQINRLEPDFEALSDHALRAQTDSFRRTLALATLNEDDPADFYAATQNTLLKILPQAFAAVREASKRTIGLRHYDVQLLGGYALHQGKIAEMRTGEGKTLVATLPVYLNALALNFEWVQAAREKWDDDPERWDFIPLAGIPVGAGVHLITVNDYLARRDARWMAPIYEMLGLSIGVLQMAARTENGKRAFLIDLQKESAHEDQHQLRLVPRREAYAADITYGTNSEFGFDYLRDNMTMRLEDRVQRGHVYAIIDEVDNVLIDEARTPLIISGPAHDDTKNYIRMAQVVKQLAPEHYELNERDRSVTLTEAGEARVEELLGETLRDPERPEDITHEQARLLGFLEQALRAQHLFKRNKEYLVQGRKIVIIDEFTGRQMPGRRWSDGLHQAIEAKEGVEIQPESVTYATITIQNYFRMYKKLSGMTGTAATEAEEFNKIYKLDVLTLPTNLEYQASRTESGLVSIEAKDEDGYKYTYYARKDDPNKTPVLWKRKDYPDVVYRTFEAKIRAILTEVLRYHTLGRPLLLGTTSVELSELISERMRAALVERLAQVLVLRRVWFTQHNREEDGREVAELVFLDKPLPDLEVSELRRMARELGISLNPTEAGNLPILLEILKLQPAHGARLTEILKAGVSHQVLNARKHTEESQIIAGAGAFGAVTIATNMAGRGVDIKLGGELAEEHLAILNRVISRADSSIDPYNLSPARRYEILKALPAEDYGIYEAEVSNFLQHIEDMQTVRTLGGLHVIGSERHEARRIDNQLRGRAARQGDPGSSRFYISLEDDLMRRFGGEQLQGVMARLKVDESVPLEMGLVSRIIEQAQTRVEGANFDARKHLLEYDDVLNNQRARIYAQRDRIFIKDDLDEDIQTMLAEEIQRRVPEALQNNAAPWRLLAWLEQVQPTRVIGGQILYNYTLHLLLPTLEPHLQNSAAMRAALLQLAENALKAEEDHTLAAIDDLLLNTRERIQAIVSEALETFDTYFDSLLENDPTDPEQAQTSRRDHTAELSDLLHLPLKLNRDQQRTVARDPQQLPAILRPEVESQILRIQIKRLLGAIERRIEQPLELDPENLRTAEWDSLTDSILNRLQALYAERRTRLLENTIPKNLDAELARLPNQALPPISAAYLLIKLTETTRTTFQRHKKIRQSINLFTYTYYAASLLENRDPTQIAEDVLDHLQNIQEQLCEIIGTSEMQRLANFSIQELDANTQSRLRAALGDDTPAWLTQPIKTLPDTTRQVVANELGKQTLTEGYRKLLLSVISELWVEYLTQIEALRVAIGLEAYGQRDPLIQYKNRAFQLFEELLDNIRRGIVGRMFNINFGMVAKLASTTRPEDTADLLEDEESPGEYNTADDDEEASTNESAPASSGRRRRRKK